MNLCGDKKSKLSAAIASAAMATSLLTSHTALSAEDQLVEEVVVTGIRGSAASQRDAKKNSDGIGDSIFSEDMGRMPDENIADAMQRITGIGIDRENGEGTTITVRGVDASLNNVTLNGVVLTNGGDDNAIDFSTMSADMLQSIEVSKSSSADQDEGSLGGTVNLKTRAPQDIKEQQITASVQYKTNDLAEDDDVAVKAGYANKFADGRFGVALSGYYDEKTVRIDSIANPNWDVYNLSKSVYQDSGDAATQGYEPKYFSPEIKFNDRERIGLAGSFGFDINDNSDLVLDLNYTRTNVEALTHSMRLTALTKDNVVDPVSQTSLTGGNAKTKVNQLSRLQETETDTLLAGLTYSLDLDDWKLVAKANTSRTEQSWLKNRRLNYQQKNMPSTHSWLSGSGSIMDFPEFTLPDHTNEDGTYDLSGADLFQIWDDNREVQDDYHSASVDLTKILNWGPVTDIEFGAKYFERTKDRSQTLGKTGIPKGTKLSDHAMDFPVDDYFSGVASQAAEGWTVPDFDAVYNELLPNGYEGDDDLINTYVIETKASAAYLKANYIALDDRLKGDVGIRIVTTDASSKGHQGFNLVDESVTVPFNESHSYNNVLPSFNMRYTLADDMILRGSIAEVMARPVMTQQRPGTVITATSTTPRGTGGNIKLDPTEATQFDVSWEWYFDETGMLSVAAFYKDISSFSYQRTDLNSYECPSAELVDPVTACQHLVDDAGVPVEMPVTAAVNGQGGEITGLELAYQQNFTFLPGVLKDTGIIFNYTYTDSEATYVDKTEDADGSYADMPFLNTSRDTLNTTVYWQRDGHSLRLAYNYRSERLVTPSRLTSSLWRDAEESLDFSGVFNVNDNFNVTVAATNLTNESSRIYSTLTVGEPGFEGEGNALDGGVPTWRSTNVYNSGRTYRVGVTYSY